MVKNEWNVGTHSGEWCEALRDATSKRRDTRRVFSTFLRAPSFDNPKSIRRKWPFLSIKKLLGFKSLQFTTW